MSKQITPEQLEFLLRDSSSGFTSSGVRAECFGLKLSALSDRLNDFFSDSDKKAYWSAQAAARKKAQEDK